MYDSQKPWRDLYAALTEYEGGDAYADILAAWTGRHAEDDWLVDFARRGVGPADDEDLCRLYAASRVTTLLLLRFQAGRADGTDYRGPPLSADGFRRFHESLGFRVSDRAGYHPFFHEIVSVQPAAVADTPVQLVGQLWPTLMLGELMYCRGGCAVTGGSGRVVKEIAEGSRLFWAHRRMNRPCEDLSHGWGSNSQWRTAFRRDYRTADAFRYNVDGRISLNELTGVVRGVPVATMVEVVRNRCLVRTAADDKDFFPYFYSYSEPVAADV